MLLDSHFMSYNIYFQEILLFLQNVSWLFDFPATEMLTQDIFSKIPSEWKTPLLSLSNEELNLFPSGFVKNGWPASLISFQEQCQRLTLPVLTKDSENQSYVPHKDIPNEIWRGMNPKKKIEVELLSSLVHKECQSLEISGILDVGSGHGYVDRLLLNYGYKILGLETKSKMITYTITQLKKTFPKSLFKNFEYIQLNIDSSSFQSVKEAVRKHLIPINPSKKVEQLDCKRLQDSVSDTSSEKVSMIGLHACGDLAVNSMKLFLNLSEIQSLIMVPCCYHKMRTLNGTRYNGRNDVKETFCNFPLSTTLKESITTLNSNLVLKGPFLRLAGQGTNSFWKSYTKDDHENHAFHVLSRAVLQLYCVEEEIEIERTFRKIVKKSVLDKNDFSVYINNTLERCSFISTNRLRKDESVEQIGQNLLKLWEQHSNKLKLVEIVTGLQMRIESVAESLIVTDRICFLVENGIKDVRVVKLFDSTISPRGLVYLASKQ